MAKVINFDGTSAGKALFISEGVIYSLQGGTIETFNIDGTVTYSMNNGDGVEFNSVGTVPVYAIPYSVEWRMALPGMGAAVNDPGSANVTINIHNGSLNATATLATYDLGGSPFVIQAISKNGISTATTDSLGTDLHTYRVDFTGNQLLAFIDGLQVASISITSFDSTDNSIDFQISALGDTTSVILDYVQWTSPFGRTIQVFNPNALSAAVTSSSTTLPLSTTNDFPSAGIVQVESEKIHYSFSGSNSLESCTRGFAGTTAVSHAKHKLVTLVSVDSPIGLDLSGLDLGSEIKYSNGTKVTVSGDTLTFTNPGDTKSFTITMV